MVRAITIQEATVAVIRAPVLFATLKIFSSTTSRQPARLMIPAKQKAQNTSRVVLIMPFMPPRFNSWVISEEQEAGSKPGRVIMLTLNPLTVADSTSFKATPWNSTPSTPATTVDSSMTGMVGFCSRDPASTMIMGSTSRKFQWNMVSSWFSITDTVSEVE